MNENMEEFLQVKQKGTVSVYLKAYRRLRELIVNGTFRNGEKLMGESKLAEMMGIGRTSLRTALILLNEDGYLITKQGKGTFVVYEPSEDGKATSHCMTIKQRLATLEKDIEIISVRQWIETEDDFLNKKLNAQDKPIKVISEAYSIENTVTAISQMFFIEGLAETTRELEEVFLNEVEKVVSKFTTTVVKNEILYTNEWNAKRNILLVSSTWEDENEKPLCFVKDYINTDMYRYTLSQGKK